MARLFPVRQIPRKLLELARTGAAEVFATGLCVALPLLALAAHYWRNPIWLEHRFLDDLRIDELLYHSSVDLGTFNGHRLHVLIGEIDDIGYLGHLEEGPSSLVVSMYQPSSRSQVGAGTSTKALLALLDRHSPGDRRELLRRIAETSRFSPGSILSFRLARPVQAEGDAAIESVLAIRLAAEEGRMDSLLQGIAEALHSADTQSIRSLILPCLSIPLDSDASERFDQSFAALFETLEATHQPRDLYILFYRHWPTYTLETAVSSFNSRWSSELGEKLGRVPRFYRLDLRLALLATSLCLLVNSFRHRLTWPGALLLAISFLGALLIVFQGIEWLLPGEPGLVTILKLILSLVSALLFLFLSKVSLPGVPAKAEP